MSIGLNWIPRLLIGLGVSMGLTASVLPPAASLFDAFSVSGTQLDTGRWTTIIASGSFLGRTQLRNWVSQDNIGPFTVVGGNAELALDTHNPTAAVPGDSFFGTHATSFTNFVPTATTDYVLSARMRLASIQPGLVYGVYFYGCDAGPCSTHHDELDIELVTNFLQPGSSPLRVQLNRYKEEPLGTGAGPIVNLPAGFDPLAWHVWTIRWRLDRVAYFVDGILLFEATDTIPTRPMHANVIAWAPSTGWPDAYDATLQPSATSGGNQRFVAYLDYVSVRPIPHTSPASGGLAEVNGDRIHDILLQNESNWIGAFLMNGSGAPASFAYVYPGSTGDWRVAGTADLNSDGVADIVLQNSTNWIATFLMSSSGQPSSFVYVYPGDTGGWRVVGTGDFNGDGIADLLLQNSDNWLAAFLMNGHATPVSFVYVYAGDTGGWRAAATADFNGDGITDILLQHSSSSWLGVFLMDGTGAPASFAYVYPGSTVGWQVVGAADLNGDGITDILLQHSSSSWLAAFLLDGNGAPASFEYVYPGSTGGWRVVGGR